MSDLLVKYDLVEQTFLSVKQYVDDASGCSHLLLVNLQHVTLAM